MAFRRSLSTQLLLLLLTSIGVVLGVYSFINYRSSRDEFLEFVHGATERSSDLIRRGTRDGMLLHRLDRVQETLEDIAAHPEVAAVRVYDKDGLIVLSARREEIGHRIELDSETCESCHQQDHTTDVGRLSRSGLVDVGNGDQVLRHLAVIENETLCSAHSCHPSPEDQRVLGVLDVEMSVAPVHRPVVELAEGTRRIARGDLETRIDVKGRHELADLAGAFNGMAADLEAARSEITEWSERLEQKVIEKTGELQRTQRQVLHMEKMASLGKLSATVAHELNNPIAAMLTYTRLVQRELRDQAIDQTVREELDSYLTTLQKECSRCGDIVRNLLAFARRSGAEMAPIDLNEVIERSLTLVRHHLQINGVTLHRDLLEHDSQMTADGGQLQQAFVALFVNAVEAMSGPGNGVRELTVRLDGDPDEVRIEVRDTGTGISPDVLPHVFDPFFSTKDQEAGVGLGLAVVYGIVRRHGGTIDVESNLTVGTTFRLALPRRPRPDGAGRGSQGAARNEPHEEAPR
jgi:two-component system NtrC family sensor kinase